MTHSSFTQEQTIKMLKAWEAGMPTAEICCKRGDRMLTLGTKWAAMVPNRPNEI